MGFLFVGSVGVIPQWFTTRTSFANAIGAAGSGELTLMDYHEVLFRKQIINAYYTKEIGGMIYSLSTNAIIKTISLPWAFRILGIVTFPVNTVCALLIRDRNIQVGARQRAFDLALFKRIEFLLLLGWGFFSMLGYVVLLFSLPNYASSIGLSASQGSIIGAMLNLGQGLGRTPIGYFSDSFGR